MGIGVAGGVAVGVAVAVEVGVAVAAAVGVGVGVAQPCSVLLPTLLSALWSFVPATTTAVSPPAVLTVAASANARATLRLGPAVQLLVTGS